ncbi:hypothetical protein [Pedobacter sp. WC2423]|uniref:hypothetical protein n=1 Tax=Pedobacter sp. WC2423 TaxID=3234142 RepID=UPI0034655AE5
MEKIEKLSELKLAHFSLEDESAFIEMVADPEIQNTFRKLIYESSLMPFSVSMIVSLCPVQNF